MDFPNNTGKLNIGGWLSGATPYYYTAEGNALVYTYSVAGGDTTTYRASYLKRAGYLEQSTRGSSSNPDVLATTDTSLYDALGRRIAIDTHSAGQTTDAVRAFAYDAEGEILQRRDGSASGSTFTATGSYGTQHYAYAEGQQVAEVDEGGGIDVLSGVTGFSSSDTGTSDYVAQAGDTLQSIAQQVYGDAGLWYVVADWVEGYCNGASVDSSSLEARRKRRGGCCGRPRGCTRHPLTSCTALALRLPGWFLSKLRRNSQFTGP